MNNLTPEQWSEISNGLKTVADSLRKIAKMVEVQRDNEFRDLINKAEKKTLFGVDSNINMSQKATELFSESPSVCEEIGKHYFKNGFHFCKHCGAWTSQPDEQCYKYKPKRVL